MGAGERLQKTIRELGAFNACLYFLQRALSTISRNRIEIFRYYFVAQPVAPSALINPSAAMTLREIQINDAEAYKLPRPSSVIADRYRQGARCLALFRAGEECIGFVWFVLGNYNEDEVRCRYRLGPRCAWDFDIYIEPKFRLGRAFARLWDGANQIMRIAGVRWSISRISAFNPASLTSHARLGANVIGSAIFFKAGSMQVMLATHSPYFHIAFSKNAFPELKLNIPESGAAECSSAQ